MNKPRKKAASGGRNAASGGWRLNDDRPPTFRGWISTDEGEIGRREWRGRTEIANDKSGGSARRFYRALVAMADARFDRHLARLAEKGGS